MSLALFVVILCLLGHFCACLFYAVGHHSYFHSNRFDGKNMFDGMRREWLSFDDVIEMPPATAYLHMLYLGFGTMASDLYGDIVPYTFLEQLVAVGIFMFAKFYLAFFYAEMENYV